tara:strand:- start:239 stop:646 length:408 start_codon:yes stop_codon:yes gene_type:complete
MAIKLYVVPTTHVQQYWHLAEKHLKKAIDKGHGEFDLNQLKLLVAQGQQQLLLGMEDDKCYNAATTQWIMYPNDRVAYVTYAGGTKLKEIFEQFKVWVKNSGGTSVQCSTGYKSLERLFERLNYKPKYRLMELKL